MEGRNEVLLQHFEMATNKTNIIIFQNTTSRL